MTQLKRYPFKLADGIKIAATLGNFDGLHRGHLALLSKITQFKEVNPEYQTALMSFYPHPAVVLGKAESIPKIISLKTQLRLLTQLGVDYLFLIHFTPEFSKLLAADFLQKIVLDAMRVGYLAIGEDARVGAQAQGDVKFIEKYCKDRGCRVDVVPAVTADGVRVSSRLVRTAVLEGDMPIAKKLLGRNFAISGKVIKGMRNGRAIGFPTANLNIRPEFVIPANGVYATRALVKSSWYKAVTNIGTRPTLNGNGLSIETHLLNFSGQDIYNEKLEVEFVGRIRDEIRFDSLKALGKQINLDIEKALEILR